MCGVTVDLKFTKMRNMKREMDLLDHLCGQFNEVTTIKNIAIDSKLILSFVSRDITYII